MFLSEHEETAVRSASERQVLLGLKMLLEK
jgi:hypothetical protein